MRDLVTQRQRPRPILDNTNKNRESHFLRREEALCLVGNTVKAQSDLKDLPSKKTDKKKADEENKKQKDRDAAINAILKLKSWDAKKVRGIVRCYFCNKSCCSSRVKRIVPNLVMLQLHGKISWSLLIRDIHAVICYLPMIILLPILLPNVSNLLASLKSKRHTIIMLREH